MAFWIVLQNGDSEDDVSDERMSEILREMNLGDAEHPDTRMTHESGWTVIVFGSGLVVLEPPSQSGTPRHMRLAHRTDALRLWKPLSSGDLDVVLDNPWLAGYGGRGG